MSAGGPLESGGQSARWWLLCSGRGAEWLPEHGGRRRLARGVPEGAAAGESGRLVPLGPGTELLELAHDPQRWRPSAEVLALGARRWRGDLGSPVALIHLLGGALGLRLTGCEEPFELSAGETLSVEGLAGGEEAILAGQHDDTLAVLLTLRRS